MPSKTTLLLCLILAPFVSSSDCRSKDYGNGGTVCVCNQEYCDKTPVLNRVENPNYLVYTSNKAGARFQVETGKFLVNDKRYAQEILVRSSEVYQEIIGWGGAFTDATGINIRALDENLQEELLSSYFAKDGLDYSLCRVPIGGTDFSTHGYSYDDGLEDKLLENFALAPEDFQYKIPLIKAAQTLTNNNLKLFASAWTAPKWMKFNGDYYGMFGFLKKEMYQSWAEYFVKFLDEYQKHDVEFWGISTGNEPSLAFFPINISSVAWTPWQMQNWVYNNLGPTLRQSNHSQIKLLALDDQRFFLPWYIDIVFSNTSVKDFIDGVAVHWYADDKFSPDLLTQTHDKYPDKFLLATEACKGDRATDVPVLLGSWSRGETYANSIIEDVNHWVGGWLDWNMALDVTGGPTFIDNQVDAPIIVNATGGEFYKQPMYYTLGHFSKFVPSGSVRIYTGQFDDNVPVTGFRRPDGGIVVEILNKNGVGVSAVILDENRGNIPLELTPNSMTTVVYW